MFFCLDEVFLIFYLLPHQFSLNVLCKFIVDANVFLTYSRIHFLPRMQRRKYYLLFIIKIIFAIWFYSNFVHKFIVDNNAININASQCALTEVLFTLVKEIKGQFNKNFLPIGNAVNFVSNGNFFV